MEIAGKDYELRYRSHPEEWRWLNPYTGSVYSEEELRTGFEAAKANGILSAWDSTVFSELMTEEELAAALDGYNPRHGLTQVEPDEAGGWRKVEPVLVRKVYLAVDSQEGHLVTRQEYDHWAEALLAANTDGKAEFVRDEEDYMHAEENGKPIFGCGSYKKNDDEAKNECGKDIERNLRDCYGGGRYSSVQIAVDSENFLFCDPDDLDNNILRDAAQYGTQAGYPLRPEDALRYADLFEDEEEHQAVLEKFGLSDRKVSSAAFG